VIANDFPDWSIYLPHLRRLTFVPRVPYWVLRVYRIDGHSLWFESKLLWLALRAVDDDLNRVRKYPVYHDERKRGSGNSRVPFARPSLPRCGKVESARAPVNTLGSALRGGRIVFPDLCNDGGKVVGSFRLPANLHFTNRPSARFHLLPLRV
jgi:hypothetical protein